MSDEGASNNEQLLAACKQDQSGLVQEILRDPKSVDVNCCDGVGNTPLHYAAQTGSVDCVQLLVRVPGISPNIKNRMEQDTPLHKAAALHGDPDEALEITKLLVSAGADPRIVNRLKQRPMDLTDKEHPALRRVLLQATLAFNMPHEQAEDSDGDDYSSD
ncbi:ankyrin [Martensiomyces pterosporus]|nr:ankyrin [Martensiomyces pterosporus]